MKRYLTRYYVVVVVSESEAYDVARTFSLRKARRIMDNFPRAYIERKDGEIVDNKGKAW